MEQVFQHIAASPWTPPWLTATRQQAYAQFQALGWPSRDHEDWRYTSTKALAQANFTWPSVPLTSELSADVQASFLADAYRLVFINGQLQTHLSLLPQSQGITLQPLELDLTSARPWLEAEGLSGAKGARTSLEELNRAFFNSGAFLRLDRHIKLDKPLQMLHIAVGEPGCASLICPRHILVLEDGAEATLLESYRSFGAGPFTNSASQVHLKAGARLHAVTEKVLSRDALHVHQSHFILERDSLLKTFVLTLGGQLARHEQTMELRGSGSHAQFDGLYIGRQRAHIDMNTTVLHQAPQTSSSQVYKGILHDQARAVFNGKINIAKGAQQTKAEQLNKNLLMSTDAEVDTKPQLQIDADDVRCSHGATVGRLDRNELFYLQSRGIDRDTGERMLAQAFVRDVLNRLQNPVLEQRLEQELAALSGV